MDDVLRSNWAVQAKTEIAKEVKDTLSKSMGSFGFMIIEALVWLTPFPSVPVYHISLMKSSSSSPLRTQRISTHAPSRSGLDVIVLGQYVHFAGFLPSHVCGNAAVLYGLRYHKDRCVRWIGCGAFQVTDIEPDPKVRAAMNEINAAQRMREAAMQKAEADKVMVVKRAEASAEAKCAAALFIHADYAILALHASFSNRMWNISSSAYEEELVH